VFVVELEEKVKPLFVIAVCAAVFNRPTRFGTATIPLDAAQRPINPSM
jgi:hypothetical protein